MTSDIKFYLALSGQTLSGVASPFISAVPNKISQHWFSGGQSTLATTLLGMSKPIGIFMGQMFTPLMVQDESQIPIMNIVWFGPAFISTILVLWQATSDLPLTPSSADIKKHCSVKSFFRNLKSLLANWQLLILSCYVGAVMGYVSTISTKVEQLFCSRGYSDQLAGSAGALMVLIGSMASIPFGYMSKKTKKPTIIVKISSIFIIASITMMGYFMRLPDQSYAILASAVLFGTFAIGPYPIILDLIIECTYPIDQVC